MLRSRIREGIDTDAAAHRLNYWAAKKFVLPTGLPTPSTALVSAQEELIAQLHRSAQLDEMFSCPVELIWGRLLADLRNEPWCSIVADALKRIYDGRTHFGTYIEALRTGILWSDIVSFNQAPPMSDPQRAALLGAAALGAFTVYERCLDLARRLCDYYAGATPRADSYIASVERSRDVIGKAILPSAALKAAAVNLVRDQLPAITGGTPSAIGNLSTWTDVRHQWAHGRDQDGSLVTEDGLDYLGEAISDAFGWTSWFLFGENIGTACSEWNFAP